VSVGGDHFVMEMRADSAAATRGVAGGDRGDGVGGGQRNRANGQVPAPRPTRPEFDDPGFRDYVTARSRSLLRTAYLLTGNRADAEDLLQSALAKTYLAWDRIEDRRRLEEYPTDEIPDQAVADQTGISDLADTLRRAVDRLPRRMRAAVVLRYFEDMTEAEVADVLGVSLGTVKSTVSRAVAKLRIDAELQAE
jgi:DNA-directed RNA polymerase specialized sigma24 family protein